MDFHFLTAGTVDIWSHIISRINDYKTLINVRATCHTLNEIGRYPDVLKYMVEHNNFMPPDKCFIFYNGNYVLRHYPIGKYVHIRDQPRDVDAYWSDMMVGNTNQTYKIPKEYYQLQKARGDYDWVLKAFYKLTQTDLCHTCNKCCAIIRINAGSVYCQECFNSNSLKRCKNCAYYPGFRFGLRICNTCRLKKTRGQQEILDIYGETIMSELFDNPEKNEYITADDRITIDALNYQIEYRIPMETILKPKYNQTINDIHSIEGKLKELQVLNESMEDEFDQTLNRSYDELWSEYKFQPKTKSMSGVNTTMHSLINIANRKRIMAELVNVENDTKLNTEDDENIIGKLHTIRAELYRLNYLKDQNRDAIEDCEDQLTNLKKCKRHIMKAMKVRRDPMVQCESTMIKTGLKCRKMTDGMNRLCSYHNNLLRTKRKRAEDKLENLQKAISILDSVAQKKQKQY